MSQLFELLRKLPSAVHFYLEQSVFPQCALAPPLGSLFLGRVMRFQDEKLSASGQDLGGSILFGQRIGFSGTPSDLMPRELGQCDYEPGGIITPIGHLRSRKRRRDGEHHDGHQGKS